MHTVKIVSLVFGFALMTAACGDSMSSLNPAAPSALSPDTLNVEAGGANVVSGSMANGPKPGNGNGNGNRGGGNGNGNGNNPRTPTNTSPDPTRPVPPGLRKAEFEGTISAVGDDSITVNSQLITVTDETVIRRGGREMQLSQLNVGDRVHVRAERVEPVSEEGAITVAESTFEATEIVLQNPADEDSDEEDEEDDLPSVTVQASDSTASESGSNSGTFRVSRSGSKWAPALTVTFTLTGTATNGTDYVNVPLTVGIPRGEDRVNIVVRPTADTLTEGTETVILTLTSGATYRLGSAVSATIRISDAGSR